MRDRYEIIGTRLFDVNVSPIYVSNVVKGLRAHHGDAPGVEVRRFTRAVKAGGAVIPVTVIVVRREHA